VAVADFAHARPVVRWRNDHPAGPLDGLGNEGGDSIRALEDDLALKQFGADAAELLGILGIRVAVQPRRVDMEAAGQQRLVRPAKGSIAVHTHAAEVHAVIALAQRDELGPVALSFHLPVLTRELERPFDCIRAAAAEIDAAGTVGLHQLHQSLRQLDGARMRGATKRVVEGQLIELRHDGIADFLAPESKVGAPQTAHAIDQPMSVDVPDEAALAPRNDVRRRVAGRGGISHRMQQTQAVFGLKFRAREFTHERLSPAGRLCGSHSLTVSQIMRHPDEKSGFHAADRRTSCCA
jgi:hypothetical protein